MVLLTKVLRLLFFSLPHPFRNVQRALSLSTYCTAEHDRKTRSKKKKKKGKTRDFPLLFGRRLLLLRDNNKKKSSSTTYYYRETDFYFISFFTSTIIRTYQLVLRNRINRFKTAPAFFMCCLICRIISKHSYNNKLRITTIHTLHTKNFAAYLFFSVSADEKLVWALYTHTYNYYNSGILDYVQTAASRDYF